jgi:shikimate dehydrogenase
MELNKVPTLYFIGVTTAQSAMMKIFPHWMAVLGRPDVQLVGYDCKIHDEAARYRAIVEHIQRDPLALGGLITTHKLDLLAATRDCFAELDHFAQVCDEISCIAKHPDKLPDKLSDKLSDKLVGYAVDPVADGRALQAIIGDEYFGRTGGEVLSLGAGGAAAAIVLHLITQPNAADRPTRLTLVDIDPARLDHIRAMVAKVNTDVQLVYVRSSEASQNDALLAQLPRHSVVINATGMGKDRPGSPLTDAVCFPDNSVVWELNYRGERQFMQQALAQRSGRTLRVEDGWLCFLHGWTGVLAKVLQIEINPVTFAQLGEIAAHYR